jgi:hypothetical protein
VLVGVCAIGLAVAAVPGSAGAHPGKTHIHELRASVSTANGVQWVNVRARVCVRSSAEAGRVAPDELRLTQFFIYKGRWRPLRVLIDPTPQWLVALGENWGGKACGWVEFRDLFKHPEGFAGFGSSINCVGVSFSIKVAGATATKRTPIKCGRT